MSNYDYAHKSLGPEDVIPLNCFGCGEPRYKMGWEFIPDSELYWCRACQRHVPLRREFYEFDLW